MAKDNNNQNDAAPTAAAPTKVTIAEGELAVRVTSAFGGGLGKKKVGDIMRNLSVSAFTTVTGGGFAEVIKPGTEVELPVEPAPVGA